MYLDVASKFSGRNIELPKNRIIQHGRVAFGGLRAEARCLVPGGDATKI